MVNQVELAGSLPDVGTLGISVGGSDNSGLGTASVDGSAEAGNSQDLFSGDVYTPGDAYDSTGGIYNADGLLVADANGLMGTDYQTYQDVVGGAMLGITSNGNQMQSLTQGSLEASVASALAGAGFNIDQIYYAGSAVVIVVADPNATGGSAAISINADGSVCDIRQVGPGGYTTGTTEFTYTDRSGPMWRQNWMPQGTRVGWGGAGPLMPGG